MRKAQTGRSGLCLFEKIPEPDTQRELSDPDDRNSYGKFGMLCLVTEGVHAKKRTDAAAYGSHTNEGGFRNTPAFASRFFLVGEHKKKTNRIDYQQVDQNVFHKTAFLEGFLVKKCWILVCLLLLTGCSAAETFETVDDDVYLPAMAEVREISLELPQEAAVQVMENDAHEKIYLCGDYTLTVQTFQSGDLNRTVQSLCGYCADDLQLMQTRDGALKRTDWIWTCAGEGGDQIGRAMVLDDGSYHYCLTAMAQADAAGSLEEPWNRVFSSFTLD